MAEYKAVEGELGAVNALTNLTTFGTETSGPVKVPEGARKIRRFGVAVGPHIDTAGDNVAVTLRLTGKGIMSSPQDFVIWGGGGGVTNTGTYGDVLKWIDCDIDVKPNEDITVQAAAVGDDVLVATLGITL